MLSNADIVACTLVGLTPVGGRLAAPPARLILLLQQVCTIYVYIYNIVLDIELDLTCIEVLSNADIVACTLGLTRGVDSLLALRDSSSSSNRYKLGVSSLHLDLYYMSRYRVRSYM